MFLISGTIGRLMENGLISTSKKSTIQNTQTLLVILLFFGYSIFIMFGGKMTEQNIYLSKTLKDLENLLVYYKSNMRQTEKTISLIEEAIEVKNKND